VYVDKQRDRAMAGNRTLAPGEREAIAGLPLFRALPAETAEALLGQAVVRHYESTWLLFSEGEAADHFFVVLDGAVRLFSLTPEGGERTVHLVDGFQTFAEAAIFGPGHYPVNGEVQPGTTIVPVRAGPLLAALQRDPSLALGMLAAMGQWQRFLMAEIRQMKADTPARRLAGFLLALLESGRWEGTGPLPLRKATIAGRIGIEPESLSRALRRLESAGIQCRGEGVFLTDREALRRFCQP